MISAIADGVRFTASETSNKGCRGCLFERDTSISCIKMCATALAAGLPDCDDRSPTGGRYIYVLALNDPRQVDMFVGEAA